MAELQGLEFLTENEISDKVCDLSKPFAFISYAHDEADTKIVKSVFQKLYDKGYNLWIDIANIPKDRYAWTKAADTALMYKEDTCKAALFFRSEESLIRQPIYEELTTIRDLDYKIITIDIWHEERMSAGLCGTKLRRERNIDKLDIYRKICSIVDQDNSAYRYCDIDYSIDVLVNKLEKELRNVGIDPQDAEDKIDRVNTDKVDQVSTADIADPDVVDIVDPVVIVNPAIANGMISLNDFLKKYNTKTFNKSTYARFRLVGKAQYQTYSTEWFDSAYDLTWTFVMGLIQEKGKKYIDFVNAKHPDIKNPVFITKDEYEKCDAQSKYKQVDVEGMESYYMYRHYSQFDWINTVLKVRLREFGLPLDAFYFEYVESDALGSDSVLDSDSNLGSDSSLDSDAGSDFDHGSSPASDVFKYRLWGKLYTDKNLASMMHNVFDCIAAKYPEKIKDIAKDDSIRAVTAKEDVDQKRLPDSYLRFKKDHKVGGHTYCVSTFFNRERGKEQLEKMLTICEGNANALVFESEPQKGTKHQGNARRTDSGKMGLGEFLE